MRKSVAFGFTEKINVDAILKNHNDVAPAKQEIAHRISFFNTGTYCKIRLPVTGANL